MPAAKSTMGVAGRLLMWLFITLLPWLESFDSFVERLTGVSVFGYVLRPGARHAMEGLASWVVYSIGAIGFLLTSVSAIRERRLPVRRVGTTIRAFHVLWRDTGLTDEVTGHAVIDGPGCPEDMTLLVYRDFVGSIRRPEESDFIGLQGKLFCTTCKAEYPLATNFMRVGDARQAVGRSLRGRRVAAD